MDPKDAEPTPENLALLLEEIRERVRARHPSGTIAGAIALPDLLPLLHARDAAEAKVAAIGSVNPRPPGLVNFIAQAVKRLIARALDWHVREQVEFNRAVIECVQATLDASNEVNRALSRFMGLYSERFSDLTLHWEQWRAEWTTKEIALLKNIAELEAAFEHRLEQRSTEHKKDLVRVSSDIQARLWDDLRKVREEYDALIHTELRLLRQRMALQESIAAPVASAPTPASELSAGPPVPKIDWLRFAERFRGSPDYVKRNQQTYAQRFAGAANVLDIGCGRGELLEVLRDAGIPARGIDLSSECVALCRANGLDVEQADLFLYLAALPDASLGGIVSAQVVEHLPPDRLPAMVELTHAKLKPGALLAIETPNPECLAIFSTHFYIDPTHVRPVPHALLSFYLDEAGFGQIEVERLSPAIESMPSLTALPEPFRETFFGGLDYAIFGRKR